MRKYFSILILIFAFVSCENKQKENIKQKDIRTELSNIIDSYIKEQSAKENCNDSAFFITVSFHRIKGVPVIGITGCHRVPIISFDEDPANVGAIPVDQLKLMEGYLKNSKNQWCFVYVDNKEDLTLMKSFFSDDNFLHDKEFLKYIHWNTIIDTDIWYYSIEKDLELKLFRNTSVQ